eukprot:6183471-Pleurochrysis_carterae.AAC.7
MSQGPDDGQWRDRDTARTEISRAERSFLRRNRERYSGTLSMLKQSGAGIFGVQHVLWIGCDERASVLLCLCY